MSWKVPICDTSTAPCFTSSSNARNDTMTSTRSLAEPVKSLKDIVRALWMRVVRRSIISSIVTSGRTRTSGSFSSFSCVARAVRSAFSSASSDKSRLGCEDGFWFALPCRYHYSGAKDAASSRAASRVFSYNCKRFFKSSTSSSSSFESSRSGISDLDFIKSSVAATPIKFAASSIGTFP